MDRNAISRSGKVASSSTSKRIKNTFAPNCKNEYFTPGGLFTVCRYGFPFEELPKEAKKMLLEYADEYYKTCTKPGEKAKFPSPMFTSKAIL